MKNFIYKKLMLWLVLLLPIIEILGENIFIFHFNLGSILKLIVIIFSFIYLIILDKENQRFNCLYLTFMLVFLTLNIFNNQYVIKIRIFDYLSHLISFAYHLTVLLFFIRSVKKYGSGINSLRIPTVLIGILLIINFFVNNGHSGYLDLEGWHFEFYNTVKALGSMFYLLFPLTWYNALYNKDGIFFDKFLVLLTAIAFLMIDYRFSLLIVFGLFLFYFLHRLICIIKRKPDFDFIFIIVIIGLLTVSYKLLPLQNNFDSYKNITINEIVMGDGETLIGDSIKKRSNIDFYDKVIGRSFINVKTSYVLITNNNVYDVYFMFGFVGTILLAFLYTYGCFLWIREFNVSRKRKIFIFIGSLLSIGILMILLRSVIIGSLASFWLVVISKLWICENKKSNKKKILISSHSSFAERIDKEKYDVTYLVTVDAVNDSSKHYCYPYFDNCKLLKIKFFRKLLLSKFMLFNLIRNYEYDIILGDNNNTPVDNYYLGKSKGKNKVIIGKKTNKYFKECYSKMKLNEL